jgi:ribosome-associated protein
MPRRSRRADAAELFTESAGNEPLEAERAQAEGPSRTERKRASEELQDIGERLVGLRADLLAGLPLPERLRDAIEDAKRTTSFGAKRRQAQYIGKLMRRLDAAALDAVRAALLVSEGRSVKDAAALHRAERWRESLIADDAELQRWLAEYPATDAQQLRALIRQARKDAREGQPGEAQRQGRAYRQLFALVRAQLTPSGEP